MATETIITRLTKAFKQIGTDVKSINTVIGLLTALDNEFETNTANKNLVDAINYTLAKAKTAVSASGAKISDTQTASETTWSSQKIEEELNKKSGQVIDDTQTASETTTLSAHKITSTITAEIAKVVNSAPESFDTLKEVADWIQGNADAITAINNKVPFNEVKTLSDEQKQNVWTTLGIGDYTDSDFTAAYNAAKA